MQMGGAKLLIAKHWHVMYINTVPVVGKKTCFHEGKGYCCILLPQIRPEGKVLSSQIAFNAHTTRIANVSVA